MQCHVIYPIYLEMAHPILSWIIRNNKQLIHTSFYCLMNACIYHAIARNWGSRVKELICRRRKAISKEMLTVRAWWVGTCTYAELFNSNSLLFLYESKNSFPQTWARSCLLAVPDLLFAPLDFILYSLPPSLCPGDWPLYAVTLPCDLWTPTRLTSEET